ncbi:hypothetical protein P8H27_02115 [Pseudomonas sp. sp1636]|uniref:hypothetical protein n=1 Tax=Pseudomonas sp. sp1636 TaxID=3036707 RepID=UPI0025A5F2F8|nr:hypothetical protein [Pseudomonas sp. sp1636]MDM8347690.1 hypothetical protein [Pseudomonas sp. sp1636]
MDNQDKGWVWIREIATAVSFYRVKYGEKRERVITVPYDQVISSQHEIRKHFTSVANTNKLIKYFSTFEYRHKNRFVEKKKYLNQEQISAAMQAIEESLAELVKADPKCAKLENQQLAYEIWRAWTPIRQLISNASGWKIKESDSQKALGWGTAGKKEDDQDETTT